MTRNTITKNGKSTTEERYFISSLNADVKNIARAIRGHWMVESYIKKFFCSIVLLLITVRAFVVGLFRNEY